MYTEKLPPHDIDAEEAVLGSLLIDSDAILKVAPFLKPEDFYRDRNRYCYEACISLFNRNEALNQVTVAHELDLKGRLDELGGPAYLSHLVAIIPTPLHAEHYGRIVNRTSTLRKLIQAAGEIVGMGYEGAADIEALLGRAEDVLFRVRAGQPSRAFVSLREVLDQYLEERAADIGPLERGGMPVISGFESLDQALGGLQRSDLIILAARPSLGKSSLALSIALHAARAGAVAGIFSLEMSREQVAMRLLSCVAGVDGHRLRLGLLSEPEERKVNDAVGDLSELPIYIDDTPLQTIVEMRSKARRLHLERKGLDLLVVDYLQLVTGSSRTDNRVQEIGEITRALKGLARDLHCVVLAASQLSRAVEMRPNRRP
ncbi:MAG: replicative DNA helicase, partial [Chloroflexota bacterium]|nr:replicative DNA helicase [Chloroflexota bacterium]